MRHQINYDPLWCFLAGVVVFKLARLRWLYYGPCRWCRGTGNRWGSTKKRSAPCWFCGGKGKRFKTGARTLRKITRSLNPTRKRR